MKFYKKILFLAYMLSFISCDSSRIYEQNMNIPKNKWEQSNIIIFNVQITDTVSLHNIYINLRNTGEYPMSNIFIFVKTISPLGFFVKDTFEIILADDKGKWNGKGFGNLWSNQVLYKKYVKFPYPGKYTFQYEHAMRIEKLPGIVDVGLKIEQIN